MSEWDLETSEIKLITRALSDEIRKREQIIEKLNDELTRRK